MATILEIQDLPDSGKVQLVHRTGQGAMTAPAIDFPITLDDRDRTEVSWYFQEYLGNPFGAARERAQAVENGLRNLGRLIFETLFESGEARQFLDAIRAEGAGNCQLRVVSARPEFQSIPWELMNSPDLGYLVSATPHLVRQVATGPLEEFSPDLSKGQFNILVVSPFVADTGVEYGGALASATLPVLESLDVQVELDFVSPGSFNSLAAKLQANPTHYHLVHLDGLLLDDNGRFLFEGAGSGPYPVGPATLAEALRAASVPALMVSAGDRGSRPAARINAWNDLGTRLASAGVPVSIVLPHSFPEPAVAEGFLRRLFTSLVGGEEVGQALSAARAGLMDEPHRSSLAGSQVFWDWITPTVHQACDYRPATIQAENTSPLGVPIVQQQQEAEPDGQFPAAGQYGLVGRQAELAQLERLFADNTVVLLTGTTGVGKTELALALARWLQKAGRANLPGGVFYTPFEVAHSASLERLIHEIGTGVLGLRFADMSAERQRGWVTEYLREQPSLLILDGAENIAGFPPGAPGLLTEEEQADLAGFLADVTVAGASKALLTSRNAVEDWLGIACTPYRLGGLGPHDRQLLASAIITKAGVPSDRASEEVIDLLEDIEGHPLACQVALPLLKEVPASVVRAELGRALAALDVSSREDGREEYLTALMDYAWTKMSHRIRTHLPFLSLFQRRVMMDILTHITQESAYKGVMGEELGWGACRTLLRTGLSAGFLDPISPSVYQIHPAMPRFLGAKLGRQLRADTMSRLEAEFVRVYADTADYFMESLFENQDAGATAILAEEGNLNQALGLALEARQWDNAQVIIQPLAQVYRMQQRIPELRRLRGQILETFGDSADAADAAGATDLWLYLLGTDVSESVERGDVARAQELNQQLADYLTAQSGAESDPRVASVYHQNGAIALLYRRLDEAAGWFQRSLEIIESGDDRSSVADDYFALGQVRQYQRLYTEAKDWYSKALDIHQRLPDEEEMVKDYRALGLVTQLKFEHKEAESWYHRARDMVEDQRDEDTALLIYHELGTVCHAQYNYDEAKSWYQQALGLADRLSNQSQMATELHFLGLLEQDRGIVYEEAEEWYLAALERKEELGDRRGAGDECRQLGVLFHEQGKYSEAENWYHQAREIFEQLGDVQRLARTYGQLGMVAEETDNLAGALEWTARTYQLVTEYELPVLVQVKAHLARLRDKLGTDNFGQWWLQFTGDEAPTDLDVDTSGIL